MEASNPTALSLAKELSESVSRGLDGPQDLPGHCGERIALLPTPPAQGIIARFLAVSSHSVLTIQTALFRLFLHKREAI